MGRGCGPTVERVPPDRVVVGSNPAGLFFIFLSPSDSGVSLNSNMCCSLCDVKSYDKNRCAARVKQSRVHLYGQRQAPINQLLVKPEDLGLNP